MNSSPSNSSRPVRLVPATLRQDTWPGLVQKPLRPHNWIGFLGSWFLFALGITLLFNGSMQVMGVGGFCAEGGPYEIATHCPGGSGGQVASALPLMATSLLLGLLCARGFGVQVHIYAWSALFGIEAAAFLISALMSPGGIVIGWLLNGVVFLALALAPLPLIRKAWPRSVFGRRRLDGRSLIKYGLPLFDAVAIGLVWVLTVSVGSLTGVLIFLVAS